MCIRLAAAEDGMAGLHPEYINGSEASLWLNDSIIHSVDLATAFHPNPFEND
jgi:hypothetical protein